MEKKTVVEFNVVRGSGDTAQGLSTHAGEMSARIAYVQAVERAGSGGDFRIVKRTCTYPLDKAGKPQAMGSTCDEEEVSL
jgi:hypothetical protein